MNMNMNISQMKRSLDEIVPESNENESKKSKNMKDTHTNEITNEIINNLFNTNNNNKNESINNNLDDENEDNLEDFEDLDDLGNMLISIVNNKNILNKIDNHYDANVLYKINLNLLRLNGFIVKRLNELKQKKECEINSKINLLRHELIKINKFKFC